MSWFLGSISELLVDLGLKPETAGAILACIIAFALGWVLEDALKQRELSYLRVRKQGAEEDLKKALDQLAAANIEAFELQEQATHISTQPAVQIVDLNTIDSLMGSVPDRFSRAQSKIWISGNDCAYLVGSRTADLKRALKRGIKIRLLCADPRSHTPEMLRLIDPQFATAREFEESMNGVLIRMKEVHHEFPRLLEVRLLPILPALGFF